MQKENYHNPVSPLDLILGFSGCHSSFVKKFKAIAEKKQVDLYQLIVEVSKINQKNPSDELIVKVAEKL